MTLDVVLAALLSLQNTGMADAPGVAAALLRASNGDVRVLALLISIGYHESRFLDRIQAGHCKRHECDAFVHRGQVRFRARSWFQLHRSACASRLEWEGTTGLEAERVQQAADVAARRVKRALKACGSYEAAARYYAMGSCRSPLPGAAKRAAMAARVEALLSSAPPR